MDATQDNPPNKRRAAKGGRARDRVRMAKRRAEVATLNLDGWTQTEIAKKVRVDISEVSRDLKFMRLEWAREHRGTTDEHQKRELASLQRDEKDARDHMARIEQEDAQARRTIEALMRAGDVDSVKQAGALSMTLARRDDHKHASKWHEVLLKIREARRKLLGLDAPTKVESKVEHLGAVAFTDDVARILADPDATERLLDAVQGAPVNRVAAVVAEAPKPLPLPTNGTNGANGTNGVHHH